MKIENGVLHGADGKKVKVIESPHQGSGFEPKFVVVHCTYGPTAIGAIETLTNKAKARGPSAHLVIDRDGTITQLVSFDKVAFHSGRAQVGQMTNLDVYSIGIELVNEGMLKPLKSKNSHEKLWVAQVSQRRYETEETIIAKHKFLDVEYGWQPYPQVQLDVAFETIRNLVSEYELEDVLGHDEISPKRKFDPGPAFPMEEFRERIFGRHEPLYEIVLP